MKKTILIIALLVGFVLAGCAPGTTGTEEAATISVIGSGSASAQPDTVNIQLGIEAISSDPGEAVSENAAQMNALMEVLTGLGIDESDIQTIYYNMWVEQIYDGIGQPTGEQRFHVSNQVSIRLRDLSKTGTLLEQAIMAGVNNISGITFGVADTTELNRTATDIALQDARQNAERIAEDLGLSLGEVKAVIESGAALPPMPFYEAAGIGGGDAAVPISQGEFSVTVQVQVVFEARQAAP